MKNEIVKSWVNEVIEKKLWSKYVDLHLNKVSEEFEYKETWILGGLEIFRDVTSLVENKGFKPILAFDLGYSNRPISLELINLDFVKNNLDSSSPPSIYLFPKNSTPISHTLKSSYYLPKLSKELGEEAYFRQDSSDPIEIHLVLYVI